MKVPDTFYSHPAKRYNDHIARIGASFDEYDHRLAAIFHDLGKLSEQFQEYITLEREAGESVEAFEKRRNRLKTTHTLESAYLYFCNAKNKDVSFLANFFSILKHHSDLPDIAQESNDYLAVIDGYIDNKRMSVIKQISELTDLDAEVDIYQFIDFFDALIDEDFYKDHESFFLFKTRYSRLILADKFEAIFSEPYSNLPILAEERIQRHLARIEHRISAKQKEHQNAYRTKTRNTIFGKFEKADTSRIYLIKAPTGVGKTYIALELALRIALRQKNKRRIITAIPFTSIIDQTHSEYESILAGETVLKYHHLTRYRRDDADEREQFAAKLFLNDIWHEHFIVTTFNQLLYTLFSNHNRDNVRLETLRESVIVVDEVQNIPRVLLPGVMKMFDDFAVRYDIHFIIMSATMPSFGSVVPHANLLSESWFYKKKRSRYRLSYCQEIDGFKALSSAISKHKNQSVLCVVNTIEKAKKLFNLLEKPEESEIFLLTTHQTPKHRKEIIEEIKEALKENRAVKLVATQLIEAGVDLDFDVGYREFAPFGSIIQMAGRVNREGFKDTADVYVFDFLELESKNEKLKKLPYHTIDLQEETIREWIKPTLEEVVILSNLDKYFETVRRESQTVDFETPMKNLEFATLFELLNRNFMPNQPWKVSLFVEEREGHFDAFVEQRTAVLEQFEDKFEAISRVKDLEKDLGSHTIAINHKLIEQLMRYENVRGEFFGRYVLPYGSTFYTMERGFTPELTRVEEAFE